MARKSRSESRGLAAVAGAIGLGDFPTALGYALVAWRAARCAELADLVDAIAARCREVEIRSGRAAAPFHAAWLRLARGRPSPVAIGALAATVGRNVPVAKTRNYVDRDILRFAAFLERVEALAELPADPRIASGLLAVVERAPFSIESGRRIYQPAVDLIVTTADPRSIARLHDLVARPTTRAALVRAYFAEALPAAATAISRAKVGKLADGDREAALAMIAALAPAAKPAPRGDVDQLIGECLAHPDDDGPREVLADVLLEREDPRGELIALQLRDAKKSLAGKDRTRMTSLLRAHEKAWLGDVAVVTKHRVWRRGFLDQLELARNAVADGGTWGRASVHPSLGSVRYLDKGAANSQHYERFVESTATRSLRTVTVLTPVMIDAQRRLGKPIEHVIVATPDFSTDVQRRLGDLVEKRPSVRRVTFSVNGDVDRVLDLIEAWDARTRFAQLSFAPPKRRADEWAANGARWLQAHQRLGVGRLGIRWDDGMIVTDRTGKKLRTEHEGWSFDIARVLAQLPTGRGRETPGLRL